MHGSYAVVGAREKSTIGKGSIHRHSANPFPFDPDGSLVSGGL